jgi:hypothetical protein
MARHVRAISEEINAIEFSVLANNHSALNDYEIPVT